MKRKESLLGRYAALIYFILAFIITWGSIFLVVGSIGFPISAEQIESAGPLVYVGMLVGPSLAGILMIGLVEGWEGYRELLSRMGQWRVSISWYAIALLTVPLLVLIILYFLSLGSSEYLPAITLVDDKVTLLVSGIVMGLVVAFFEEIGWTGFVVPKLRQSNNVLVTGIIVGLLWGAWHYPPFSSSINNAEGISPALYLSVLLFSFLPAYRVLLVWIYDQTNSLLLVILMHAPLSASQLILIPPTLSGSKLVTYDLIFGAALWIIVAFVLLTKPNVISKIELDQGKT